MRVDLSELLFLRQEFAKLKSSAFFASSVTNFVNGVCRRCDELMVAPTVDLFSEITKLWSLLDFLRGTIKNEVPYENVQALELVLSDWGYKEWAILTAYTNNRNYYFKKMPKNIMSRSHDDLKIARLVLPRLYKHFDLYSIALYHEVGHFLDEEAGICERIFILHKDDVRRDVNGYRVLVTPSFTVSLPHLREYVADIFAAYYIGNALNTMFKLGFGEFKSSITHPSFDERKENMNAFLLGSEEPLIDIIVKTFSSAFNCNLRSRMMIPPPEVASYFDDSRPAPLNEPEEVHGILKAAWDYVEKFPDLRDPSRNAEKFRQVNDLTEKSIRNYFIRHKWENSSAIAS